MISRMKTKVYLFSFVLIFFIGCNESKPTFGDEFVHIKVHLPKEDDDVHTHYGPSIHAHPIFHAPIGPPPPHRVIHHYHRKRRRPAKKPAPFGKHTDLLESLILSEVNKPPSSEHLKYLSHAGDIAKHVDTFIVKPEKPPPHVETFDFIEETKPKQIVETFKVIESNVPQKYHHHEDHYVQDDIEPTDSYDEDDYNYKPKKPTETYKVIDSLFDKFHAHVKEPEHQYLPPKKQRVKKVKIIESYQNEHDHENQHQHSGHGYHYNDDLEDHTTHEDTYSYASKPHSESVEIIEYSKAPHQYSHEYSINFDKRPHSETVEIVETKRPSKSTSYYKKHQHHQHYKSGQTNHGYQFEPQSSIGGTTKTYHDTTGGYEDNYRIIPEENYAPEPVKYVIEDEYLPPKRPSSPHHRPHHQQSQSQSHYHHHSLYDDEPALGIGTTAHSPSNKYLPPSPPGDSTHGSQSDTGFKATETYSGFDSYSAPHVQGLGSGVYHYP